MSKIDRIILKNKIYCFILGNRDLRPVDLSLLKSIMYDDFEGVRLAIYAGANICMEIQDGEELAGAIIESNFDDYIEELFLYLLLPEDEENSIEDNFNEEQPLFAENQDDGLLMGILYAGEC